MKYYIKKRQKMKPIIKWSGGKSQEIKFFSHKYPKKYNRYIEPFIGGGGVFFNIENKNQLLSQMPIERERMQMIEGHFGQLNKGSCN